MPQASGQSCGQVPLNIMLRSDWLIERDFSFEWVERTQGHYCRVMEADVMGKPPTSLGELLHKLVGIAG